MTSFLTFAAIYAFGGLTFIPLLIGLAFVFLPKSPINADNTNELSIDEHRDQGNPESFEKQFQRSHELDVAAGYFAVCREYVPGGQNGKPPERTTPAGEVIAEESLSVYQSMYRSIFERKQIPTIDPSKNTNGKPVKKANNVFYIVLRHHHLMLFDTSEQVAVRHVISLDHHDVSIYGGGNEIPEGELWIKRNAIRLERKPSASDMISVSKPFFLFSDNCSEKEDFYFALMQNQEPRKDREIPPPRPQQFELKDIIALVQKLHSSEEHLHTRWFNAFIGRLFLAIYKTKAVEDHVRMKITKKIARITKPAFLSGIVLQKIDLGQSAPHVMNPRLRDLNVDGECSAEAEVKYNGNFRLEVAATARIDLGTRFKAREVNLVLAVVIKKLEGRVIFRLKPPPSNRIWFSFEKMPNIEMRIEPIVSSRQITYSIILRTIESKIREVIAETIVLPHYDDIPFTDTAHQHFRGGIWKEVVLSATPSPQDKILHPQVEDGAPQSKNFPSSPALPPRDERSLSMPALVDSPSSPKPSTGLARKSSKLNEITGADVASGNLKKPPSNPRLHVLTGGQKMPEMPKAIRTLSSTSSGAATPVLSTDNANTEATAVEPKAKNGKPSATSAMIAISSKSQPASPINTLFGSPYPPSSFAGNDVAEMEDSSSTSQATLNQSIQGPNAGNHDLSHPSPSQGISSTRSISDAFGSESFASKTSLSTRQQQNAPEKGKALAAIGATAVAAKKWGWNVLSRTSNEQKPGGIKSSIDRAGLPAQPMGRGTPIPFSNLSTTHKRKQLPPPLLPERSRQVSASGVAHPPLPQRHSQNRPDNVDDKDGMLVVKAPAASEPASPLSTQEEFVFHMKVNDDDNEPNERLSDSTASSVNVDYDDPASLSRSHTTSRDLHADVGEHYVPPSWTAAQEEGRAQSIWAEESGLT